MWILWEYKHTFILSVKPARMGNFSNPLLTPSSIDQLTSLKLLSPENKEKYIVKEMMAHSSEQHHQLLIQLSKFKQYQSAHVVRLVDSHTMQSNNLCSIITYVYAILERPNYTLQAYLGIINQRKSTLCDRTVTKMLADMIKALAYLRQEGNEVDRIREEHIFIDQDEKGEVVTKIMNPHFFQPIYEAEEGNTAIVDIGRLLKKYLRFQLHSQELIQTVSRMANGAITLEELEEKYVGDGRKGKTGLRLTKGGNGKHRTARADRQSFTSIVSNGSSLMIQGGDTSDLALKEFYENLDAQISNIEPTPTQALQTSYTTDYMNISHQFPKKYLKNRAFKKTLATKLSQASEQKQNITRDQSLKQNVRIQPRPILLHSAKLVQSFIQL